MKINNLVAELAKQNLTNDEILWYKFCENFNLDCNLIENNFYKINDENNYYKILGLCWKLNHEIENGSDFLNNELIIHYKKFKRQHEYPLTEHKNTINSIPLCDSIDSLDQSLQNYTSIISTLASTQTLTSATHTFNNSFNDYLNNINEKIDSLNSNNKLMDDENYMTFDELFKYYYPENNRNYQWPEIKLQKFKIIMI